MSHKGFGLVAFGWLLGCGARTELPGAYTQPSVILLRDVPTVVQRDPKMTRAKHTKNISILTYSIVCINALFCPCVSRCLTARVILEKSIDRSPIQRRGQTPLFFKDLFDQSWVHQVELEHQIDEH